MQDVVDYDDDDDGGDDLDGLSQGVATSQKDKERKFQIVYKRIKICTVCRVWTEQSAVNTPSCCSLCC